jgi:phosphoglycolate phosphatase
MKWKAVVFDLDGTLLDTLEDLADSMNRVLAAHNYPAHEVEKYKYFVGDGMRTLVWRTFPEGARTGESVEAGLAEMKEEYARRWNNKTKPYGGIPEMLDGLVSKGLKLAVLSNKADHFSRLMVEKLLPDWPFNPVFGERQGVSKKPDPAGALEIAGMLGVTPEECLYLGDTGVDMKTATAAGMYPVGVLWGFRKAEELVENGARILIAKPLTVLDLL